MSLIEANDKRPLAAGINSIVALSGRPYIQFMGIWKNISGRMAVIGDLWLFIRCRKRYWLLPIIVFLFLLSLLIVVAETSAVAPFIYTIF